MFLVAEPTYDPIMFWVLLAVGLVVPNLFVWLTGSLFWFTQPATTSTRTVLFVIGLLISLTNLIVGSLAASVFQDDISIVFSSSVVVRFDEKSSIRWRLPHRM
jgi:hypothetical protein